MGGCQDAGYLIVAGTSVKGAVCLGGDSVFQSYTVAVVSTYVAGTKIAVP